MDLDLQNLEPEPKEVTINKVTFLVYPAKVRAILKIEKFFNEVEKDSGNDAVSKAIAILEPLIPLFKKEEVDFTLKQLISLLNYVYQEGLKVETEEENKKAKEVVTTTEEIDKKK